LNTLRRYLISLAALVLSVHAHAQLKVDVTPEAVARGEYLVLRVLGCQGCHSERNLDMYGYPPKADRVLAGGMIFRAIGDHAISPNITPFALGDWTDQQLLDAITKGIRPDGRVLAPEMPYEVYGTLSRESLHDMIAYLRSIDPIAAGPYPAEFPTDHEPFEPQFGTVVDPGEGADEVSRGAYLVKAANCNGCHAGVGEGVDGKFLAGGREFVFPGRGLIRAANLTPDSATGMGAWTRESLLARFKAMRGSETQRVQKGSPNTVMHWWQYAYWNEPDLSALQAYLSSIPPVANRVVRFEPLPGVVTSPNWSER